MNISTELFNKTRTTKAGRPSDEHTLLSKDHKVNDYFSFRKSVNKDNNR